MIDPKLMSYGVAAAVTIVILKIVFEFVREVTKKNVVPLKNTPCAEPLSKELVKITDALEIICKDLKVMKGLSEKLWSIHDQYNEDGAPKWFFPVSAKENIEKIKDIVKKIEQKKG